MPGMNSGLNSDNPALVAAFRSALLHQGILVLAVFGVLALAWAVTRGWARPPGARAPGRGAVQAEPLWRHVLRIGFGVLWIFDGLLQAQPAMAGGLPAQVIKPAAASSPDWVQHLVNWAGTSWSYHPVQAAAAVVWIQIGIGIWLITAPRGPWSRLAGLASAGWGLVVWTFGEAFGGIFAPGLTWLFGAPGARAVLLRGRRADRRARAQLAHSGARPGDPVRAGRVLPRHGGAAGLAGPRLLAGTGPAAARSPAWSGPWRPPRSPPCSPGGSAASRPSPRRTDSR